MNDYIQAYIIWQRLSATKSKNNTAKFNFPNLTISTKYSPSTVGGILQNLDRELWTGPWTGLWTGALTTLTLFLLPFRICLNHLEGPEGCPVLPTIVQWDSGITRLYLPIL